ncbi:MAG: DUF4424 domain-containing protein [Rhizobiaceae bacterium]
MMLRRLLLALLASAPLPALANDSTAELGTGGLILSRTDAISMDSEDLFISEEQVKVDYVFTNHEPNEVRTIVAFPMPDIEGNPFYMAGIPDSGSDNFLDFTVTMDGKPINAQLEQKAFAVGVDVTKELEAQGIPLNPYGEETEKALDKISDATEKDWVERGIIITPEWDDGEGMKKHRSPFWRLKSTFWWEAIFAGDKQVKVSHSYKPSVGGSAGLTFYFDGKFEGEYDRYVQKYCLDEPVKNAVLKSAKENPDGYPPLFETRISYVLTTGGNWATGTIGKFKLTVDKGDPKHIVSFCGDGVKKTGPTTFEVNATDYYPARDVDILILKKWEPAPEEPSADRSLGGKEEAPMIPGPQQGAPRAGGAAPTSGAGDSGAE